MQALILDHFLRKNLAYRSVFFLPIQKLNRACPECDTIWTPPQCCDRNSQFNSLPNNKTLDWLKLNAFVDDKINVTGKLKLVMRRVENIVGKEENAGDQHFLFPTMFAKGFSFKVIKLGIVGQMVNKNFLSSRGDNPWTIERRWLITASCTTSVHDQYI